jgi:hypothetical protein
MGILLIIAGLIVAVYTLSSVTGLWMSYKVMQAKATGQGLPEALQEIPDHHVVLLGNYAQGWRKHFWSASIIALFTVLLAMVAGSALAYWAMGVALIIDAVLYMTYSGMKTFIAQSNVQERWVDAIQCCALLAVFSLFFWVYMRPG